MTPLRISDGAGGMRVYNFSAGPATLPLEVLEQAREELTDWDHSGMSVMEVSHRGAAFSAVAERAETDLRELLDIPANYRVLFLQGGATLQFAMVPLNLALPDQSLDYVRTGAWSAKAVREADRLGRVNVVGDSAADDYRSIPPQADWQGSESPAYLHYTPNETIHGVEFHWVPETGDVPLVADMSSTILSRPLDVSRFGLIYAGAQKNIGPAGLTVVIVRDELVGRARPGTPSMLDYRQHADDGSMFNTPPTFSWYMAGLVFQWLKRQGGLTAIGERNARKAERLYAAIDRSSFYNNPVLSECRSRMNVPFTLADESLDRTFLNEATEAGLTNLKGHRSVGGMRASLYNALPVEAVDRLIEFMADFEARHG